MNYAFRIITVTIALIFTQCFNVAMAQETFPSWLEGLKQTANTAGISDKTSAATINHIKLLPDVIVLDRAQPEFISPFLTYYYKRVDTRKIQKGRELLATHDELLTRIEAQYGVPKTILVAFWGMETQYGSYLGNVDTLSALATLAYDGRRAAFFRSQLLDAMRMIDMGHANVDEVRGSWAGAFGNMQFMPTTFMLYAVDGDNDNKIDVLNSLPDAFASAANYLSQVGWRPGEPTMIEVQLPENFPWQYAQYTLKKSTEEWAQLGVRVVRVETAIAETVATKNTRQLKSKQAQLSTKNKKRSIQQVVYQAPKNSVSDNATLAEVLPSVSGQASIILPQGWLGPAFMVFDNFDVIMDWNRSVNYALSVAQLAKRLNQESRIIGGRLAEAGALSFEKMFELQNALNMRGFDAGTPDGFPGLKTQAAVRAYQLSMQLPADGYASPSVYDRLMSQP
ncbi:MAG: lytic murein transglycosylase [Methylotenera sp. RIFCSPLOWO2_02_FULL_45_14]|nr:MAG: lytic murein transglycosylase [Methylotenera sp. RIFCSPLOWO2_02_FULL_45_14]